MSTQTAVSRSGRVRPSEKLAQAMSQILIDMMLHDEWQEPMELFRALWVSLGYKVDDFDISVKSYVENFVKLVELQARKLQQSQVELVAA